MIKEETVSLMSQIIFNSDRVREIEKVNKPFYIDSTFS